jgi:hypothetical protein
MPGKCDTAEARATDALRQQASTFANSTSMLQGEICVGAGRAGPAGPTLRRSGFVHRLTLDRATLRPLIVDPDVAPAPDAPLRATMLARVRRAFALDPGAGAVDQKVRRAA